MTHSNQANEIQTGKEERSKSAKTKAEESNRGKDGCCFNFKVIAVSLNALLIFGSSQDRLTPDPYWMDWLDSLYRHAQAPHF